MDKSYLIQFNADGTRLNTYANTVHYQVIEPQPITENKTDTRTGETTQDITGYTEEQIINIGTFDYQSVLDNGGVWFNEDDYNKLVGNDGKEYIYKNGLITEKPPYIPTDEEIKQQKLSALENEYATQKQTFLNDLAVATLSNNTEAVQSLQQEYSEFQSAYEQAKNDIIQGVDK